MSYPLSVIAEAVQTYQTPVSDATFEARLTYARRHSRYMDQLLIARPEISGWLSAHAGSALTAEDMKAFLTTAIQEATADIDDALLRKILRQLRQIGRAHV